MGKEQELSVNNSASTRELSVNGCIHTVAGGPDRSLLSVLRDDLDLTGAKYGCGEAQCGACVVLLDGRPVPSCVTSVGEAATGTAVTIEGLADGDTLHPVQEAFLEADALQCGYCTPGLILAVVALLRENADPAEAEVRRILQNHLCRCGTYPRILRAVRLAAQKQRRPPPKVLGQAAGREPQ